MQRAFGCDPQVNSLQENSFKMNAIHTLFPLVSLLVYTQFTIRQAQANQGDFDSSNNSESISRIEAGLSHEFGRGSSDLSITKKDHVTDEHFEKVLDKSQDEALDSMVLNSNNNVSDKVSLNQISQMFEAKGADTSTASPEKSLRDDPTSCDPSSSNESVGEEELQDICPVCREEFKPNDEFLMDCCHRIHFDCAVAWVKQDPLTVSTQLARCPICRKGTRLARLGLEINY